MRTEIQITKHAKQRFNRTGLPKKILLKKAKAAFLDGLSQYKVKGSIKKYIKDIINRYPEVPNSNIRISSGFVWVFTGMRLITLYPLPGSMSKYVLI